MASNAGNLQTANSSRRKPQGQTSKTNMDPGPKQIRVLSQWLWVINRRWCFCTSPKFPYWCSERGTRKQDQTSRNHHPRSQEIHKLWDIKWWNLLLETCRIKGAAGKAEVARCGAGEKSRVDVRSVVVRNMFPNPVIKWPICYDYNTYYYDILMHIIIKILYDNSMNSSNSKFS